MEKCGCKLKSLELAIQAGLGASSAQSITGYEIIFCPLHSAAGEMLEELEEVAEDFDTGFIAQLLNSAGAERARARQEARIKAIILKAKGE